MAAAVRPRRKKAGARKRIDAPKAAEAPKGAGARRVPKPEAPDWGEPIGEAPETRLSEGAEAPDAGVGEPYECDY